MFTLAIVLLIHELANCNARYVEAMQILKEVLITVGCLLDIPFWHTFGSGHIILTLCLNMIILTSLPFHCCLKVLNAAAMYLVLFPNILVRSYLYFGLEVSVSDLVANIIILCLFVVFIVHDVALFLTDIEARQNEYAEKNQEFSSILNNFPEGVLMTSYNDESDEEDQGM